MIVFDSFLCCIDLKLFGKAVGWVGTMICALSAYAAFLIASGRKTAGESASNHMIFAKDLSIEEFYYYMGLVIILLLIIAVFHIMLLCGVKYRKSMFIVPYILVSVVLTASMICILPSEIHVSKSNGDEISSPYLIIGCIFTLISSVYFSLCIYSLYELIKYEEKRRKLYSDGDAILIAPVSF